MNVFFADLAIAVIVFAATAAATGLPWMHAHPVKPRPAAAEDGPALPPTGPDPFPGWDNIVQPQWWWAPEPGSHPYPELTS